MLRIRVSTASAEITETELITTGRRGLECAFEFNSAWDGLAKTVIVNGVVKRDIVLVSDSITVPGECLAREQFPLRIGVYGANGAGEIVIPTIWANFGKILPSARPSGVNPDEVTPDVVAQIQANSSDALRLAQEVMRRADSGEFNGRDGATGPRGEDGTDGQNGNSIWTTTETPMPASGGVVFTQLTGRSGIPPVVGDVIVRSSRYVYQVVEVTVGGTVVASLMGDIKGEQGVADAIWRTTASIGSVYPFGYVVNVSDLVGRSGATPKAGDLVIGPESGQTGDPTYLYTISGVGSSVAGLDGIGSIKGATGATGPQGPGVTEDLRAALLQLAQKVAYVDEHGADYYQDLYNALYLPSDIVFITAVFNQGTTKVMDTDSLDSLKPMLTVFGRYDDNTSVVLTNYTLTGVLTPGTSTVTVSALGKTTTFDVLVTGMTSISAVYTQSGTVYDTDSLDSLKADLVVTAHYSDSSTATVAAADYTLSGTLTAGTSTITVSYGGKTTTFNVTVTRLEIRVFRGKGTSGTTIVDNAKRALSEPVAFTNVAPITIEWPSYSSTKMGFKNTTTNHDTIDTTTVVIVPIEYLGKVYSSADGWLTVTSECGIAYRSSTSQPCNAYTYPTTSGYARLLFANASDTSSPLPTDPIDGVVYINSIPHHLVEADISEFE